MDDFKFDSIKLEPVQFKQESLMSLPLRDIRDDLVLDTGFTVRRGSDDVDQSGSHSDLTLSGPTRTKGFGNGNALSFDGTDDYLYDKVYASEEGTVRISTVNGQAFLQDSSQDFTNYAGDGSDNKYMVVIKDAEDDVAWGYAGAEGTGETLGSELHDDSNAAADPNSTEADATTGWGADPTGGAIASSNADPNTGSFHFDINGAISGRGALTNVGTIPTVTGTLYKLTFDIKVISGSFKIDIRNSGDTSVVKTLEEVVNNSSYTSKSYYWTALGTNERIRIISDSGVASQSYVDNLSVKEVTEPATNTGIRLYSTKTGSTRNLAGIDGSFDPNDTLTYEVRSSAFQISTGDFSIAVLLKTDETGTRAVIYKRFGGLEEALKYFSCYIDNGIFYANLDDDIESKTANTDSTINDNQWHVIIVVYDRSGNLTIYLDGIVDGTPLDISGVATIENSNNFYVGAYNRSTYWYKDEIGLVRFYRKALTAAEVRNLYYYLLHKHGLIDSPYRGY